jgi:hypothetical protein
MGRALSRYLPLDVAILGVIESVMSFTEIFFTLNPPLVTSSLCIANPLVKAALPASLLCR